jgi:hypothetical protein
MVKKSSKVNYEFEGQQLNIKQIFSRCKKRRDRSKYLLSVEIMVGKEDSKNDEHLITTKIVYVRNRNNKQDWLALISTDTSLSEEEIIRIYGKFHYPTPKTPTKSIMLQKCFINCILI